MTSHVHQLLHNLREFKVDNDRLLESLRDIWGPRSLEFRESLAETLLEAIRAFVEDDEMDRRLIELVEALLRDSDSVSLRTRLWTKRLPLEYAKPGRLGEGCALAGAFLRSVEGRAGGGRQGWTNRDNAEVGTLRIIMAGDARVEVQDDDGPGPVTERERWLRRAAVVDAWAPLGSNTVTAATSTTTTAAAAAAITASPGMSASALEHYVFGLGVRMRGKLAKDFGQFADAFRELGLYCEQYAQRGSREEGWAIGDWAELVLELEGGDGAASGGHELLRDLWSLVEETEEEEKYKEEVSDKYRFDDADGG